MATGGVKPATDADLVRIAEVVERGDLSVFDEVWLGRQMPAVLARLQVVRQPQLALFEETA